MKKALLLVSLVSLFWACQKKEYPLINNPHVESYGHSKASPTEKPTRVSTQEATSPEQLTASMDDSFTPVAEAAIPAKAFTAKAAPSVRETSAEDVRAEQVTAKKIQKKIQKAKSPEKGKKAKARIDTVSLFSLISGVLGLVFLVITPSVGLLLGLVGLILGIVGLRRISRDVAPSSSRTMALLGIIFGGVVVLLGIVFLALVASFGLL